MTSVPVFNPGTFHPNRFSCKYFYPMRDFTLYWLTCFMGWISIIEEIIITLNMYFQYFQSYVSFAQCALTVQRALKLCSCLEVAKYLVVFCTAFIPQSCCLQTLSSVIFESPWFLHLPSCFYLHYHVPCVALCFKDHIYYVVKWGMVLSEYLLKVRLMIISSSWTLWFYSSCENLGGTRCLLPLVVLVVFVSSV